MCFPRRGLIEDELGFRKHDECIAVVDLARVGFDFGFAVVDFVFVARELAGFDVDRFLQDGVPFCTSSQNPHAFCACADGPFATQTVYFRQACSRNQSLGTSTAR